MCGEEREGEESEIGGLTYHLLCVFRYLLISRLLSHLLPQQVILLQITDHNQSGRKVIKGSGRGRVIEEGEREIGY